MLFGGVVAYPCCLAWIPPTTTDAQKPCGLVRTALLAAASSSERQSPHCHYHQLESVLHQYGFGPRLETISSSNLPVTAEVFVNGKSKLAEITSFVKPNSANKNGEPKVTVKFLEFGDDDEGENDDAVAVVDFGQITSVWCSCSPTSDAGHLLLSGSNNMYLEAELKRLQASTNNVVEPALDKLYRSRVGRARSSRNNNNTLTKKQLSKLVLQFPKQEQQMVETVLRKTLKAGTGLLRLVDSAMASEYIYYYAGASNNKSSRSELLLAPQDRQAIAALLLSRDAISGGRFKRWPCIFLSSSTTATTTYSKDKAIDGEEGGFDSISFINGGWLVVDQSVRAGTEARKFVERSASKDSTTSSGNKTPTNIVTSADERIARRLECLAMGELFNTAGEDDFQKTRLGDRYNDLELDVRETLNALDLPLSPAGAKEALVRIGRWSGDEKQQAEFARTIQPWSRPIVEAAACYAKMVERRKRIVEKNRIDLTQLPCVSVDARSAAFRGRCHWCTT